MTPLHVVGVFQDDAWAEKGVDALRTAGFGASEISVIAKPGSASSTTARLGGVEVAAFAVPGLDGMAGAGPLVELLRVGEPAIETRGLASALTRAGFQRHDGRIFEALLGRGGILVAIASEPRAADALAILHSYGAGNAAIGAWMGRLAAAPSVFRDDAS
jgi:hypothetical protein